MSEEVVEYIIAHFVISIKEMFDGVYLTINTNKNTLNGLIKQLRKVIGETYNHVYVLNIYNIVIIYHETNKLKRYFKPIEQYDLKHVKIV